MFRKVLAILITALLIMPASIAFADVIIEPENDFYYEHQDKMVYLARSFVANGDLGSVKVVKEPGAKDSTSSFDNGVILYVQYSCLYDGEYWGYILGPEGWVKMDQLLVLYDYVAFYEDHAGEFYNYTGDFSEIQKAKSAVVWPWPGADEYLWTLSDINPDSFGVAYAYKDSEGREWGFINYYYANRDIWVCLSDPLNKDLPVLSPAPAPSKWVSETKHIDIKGTTTSQGQTGQSQNGQSQTSQGQTPQKDFPLIPVIIALVVVLVVGTGIVIRVLWKPKKEG